MGCELNPRIIYTEFTAIIRKQKEVFTIFRYSFIVSFFTPLENWFQIVKHLIEMKQQEISQVHPGLNCFKDGVREIPIDSIPGLKLTGWRPSHGYGCKRVIEETFDSEQLYQALRTVLNQVGLFTFCQKKNKSYLFFR